MLLLFYMMLGLGSYLSPHRVNGQSYKEFRSRCSFDADISYWPDWVSSLPDVMNISSLSIPGTHDTMTYTISNSTLQCQNWDLKTQIYAGIRYIDIRARVKDNILTTFHGDEPTGVTFERILLTIYDWLDTYPREWIIMRLKEEGEPLGNNNMTFQEVFEDTLNNYYFIKERAKKHWFAYNTSMAIPSVAQLRGKILFLQDFPSTPPWKYGIEWNGPQMILQDEWIVKDVNHLDDKWKAIEEHFEITNFRPNDNSYLYVSHLSASVGVLPVEAAAGPLERSIVGMNDRSCDYIEWHYPEPDALRLGTVISDFPGKVLIFDIIRYSRRSYND
ncbi:hypothetical protein MHUMG1_02995 [Metarhizium humberi]|uniref:Phosphatidylinositol-specific phospholipase C X domain-containing protein n=1 Tax=Metarhizium humberi TaxID=2596975 RepID=A0A9P8MEF9_9HYPO|nr:hypothetical protein MHUMG1_02995 [Metarhizium humberi]